MKSDPLVHSTEPTTSYWQMIESAVSAERLRPPFRFGCPVLPIRRREHKDSAVASFIANHASFAALDTLADHMAAPAAACLYVDPNLVPRPAGARALIVDDTISTGATALAALELARRAGAKM